VDEVIVVGDELNVAGFRLAGVAVRCPPPAELVAACEQALKEAKLVVLGRGAADALGPERLRRAWQRESPLVVVLPEVAAPQPERDFVQRLRAVLGIEG